MFAPNKTALEATKKLFEDGKLKPVVDTVFGFDQVPDAYAKLKSGHARGKQVIDMTRATVDSK